MFCPNCGKDCQDFNFCPDCGRYLREIAELIQQETANQQSIEKPQETSKNPRKSFCPECSSTNISVEDIDLPIKDPVLYWNTYAHLAGAVNTSFAKREYRKKQERGPQSECMDCGHKWFPKMIGMREQYRPYLAPLLGENNSVVYYGEKETTLTLEWDRLIINSSKGLKSASHPYEIWYKDLCCLHQVLHNMLTKEPEPRWLTICDKKHKNWTPPGTPRLVLNCPFSIMYDASQIEEFRKVKDALNGIIEENKKAGLL